MIEDAFRMVAGLLLGVPLLLFVLTASIIAFVGMLWLVGYMVMYVVGIPLAIAYRVKTGRWPG
jgi:hypothetical protein